jgi:hypothetical protein
MAGVFVTTNNSGLSAIGVSLLTHVILGLSLALYVTTPPVPAERLVLTATSAPIEEPFFDSSVSLVEITIFDDDDTSIALDVDEAMASAQSEVLMASLEVESVPDAILAPSLTLAVEPLLLDEDEVATLENTAPLPRQPGGVVAAKEVGAVIDRLAAEIAKQSAEKETTVYWLLDASLRGRNSGWNSQIASTGSSGSSGWTQPRAASNTPSIVLAKPAKRSRISQQMTPPCSATTCAPSS